MSHLGRWFSLYNFGAHRLRLAGVQLLDVHLYVAATRLVADIVLRHYTESHCFDIWEWHQMHSDLADRNFLFFMAVALEATVQDFLGVLVLTRDSMDAGSPNISSVGTESHLSAAVFIQCLSWI
jgi:hypothetical protein